MRHYMNIVWLLTIPWLIIGGWYLAGTALAWWVNH